ncbi:MSCRAMM family protein [Culicoidibacter larvae]|uniref:SpaA-like prealbumin fold domain-containing protein n=1 Tax=Culicoidibacter larvae TaxID=2579976 RepID=A0A5R8Q732_9FIRM|nr:prealbumin-like fold domain-containing protein [Culicoidibacter larvae]TLG71153.1 hypothetical protein FEZ08_11405 [Culicoidibacter larvae]
MKQFIKFIFTFLFVMLIASSTMQPVFASSENNQTIENTTENINTEDSTNNEVITSKVEDTTTTNSTISNNQLYSRHVTYQMGDYDILVPYNGVMTHPKDIEGFVYNDGEYPQYPKGWLNAVTEKLNEQLLSNQNKALLRSSVRMYEQLGYIDGNGYRTFINRLESDSKVAFCAQRTNDPVSYSDNFSDPSHFNNIKMTQALYVAWADAYGIMGNNDTNYKYVVAQSSSWYGEGTADYWSSVYAHGYGDVSGKYRQVNDKVNALYNGSSSLNFTETNLSSHFDPITNTITTTSFKIKDDSASTDVVTNIKSGYYITKVSDNTPVTKLTKGNEYVIRTANLIADESISLKGTVTMPNPQADIVYPPMGFEDLQALFYYTGNDPKSASATLTADIAPAYIQIGGFKANEDFEVLPDTEYGLYDNQARELTRVMTDETGKFLTAPVSVLLFDGATYIREVNTADPTQYALDYEKYYLPDLTDPNTTIDLVDGVYYINDNQMLINEYVRAGEMSIYKDDFETGAPLADAEFKVTRLTGEACVEETDSSDNNTESNTTDTNSTENTTGVIDCQVSFTVKTGADGYYNFTEEQLDQLLYGDYVAEEIVAPNGYIPSIEKAYFTVDSESKVIRLVFHNQKIKALVETGQPFDMMIIIGVGIGGAGMLLFAFRKKKLSKKLTNTAAAIALTLALAGGTVLANQVGVFAATEDDIEYIEPLLPDATAPTDPIEGITKVPEVDTIVITPDTPVSEVGTIDSNTSSATTAGAGQSDVSGTEATSGSLPFAGEHIVEYALIGAGMLAFVGLLIVFNVVHKKSKKKEESQQ